MAKTLAHPGFLLRDKLEPFELSVKEAAERLGMTRVSLSRVLNGHAAISADLAVRLERAGVGAAREWSTLQAEFDLAAALARKQPRVRPLSAR